MPAARRTIESNPTKAFLERNPQDWLDERPAPERVRRTDPLTARGRSPPAAWSLDILTGLIAGESAAVLVIF
jgi:hypothetical protein